MQQTFPMLMILLLILIAYHVPVQVGGAKRLLTPVGFAMLLIPGERQVRKTCKLLWVWVISCANNVAVQHGGAKRL